MTNIVNAYQEKMAARTQMDLEIKAIYEIIITDKSVDLNTRWDFFINAPTEFKNHEYYVRDFDTIDKYCPDFSWYDDMGLEKYESMTTEKMVNKLYDKAISYNTYEYAKKDKIGKTIAESSEFFNELKEEILEANLGSMKFDW